MTIPFIRVRDAIDVDTSYEVDTDMISLKGVLNYKERLFSFEGSFKGTIKLTCDLCSSDYEQMIDDNVTLWFSDGAYNSRDDETKDIIEFFDGVVDFDEVIRSEVESIKLEYHKCGDCEENSQNSIEKLYS